jgi:anthranilate synthase component 1
VDTAQLTIEKFRDYARDFNVIPVARVIEDKNQTPLSIYAT